MQEFEGESNLRNLVAIGHLEAVAVEADLLVKWVMNATRLLSDARQSGVSIQTRCIAAYTAAHMLSLAALHVRGYAPSKTHGHRAIVFQTLAPVIGADPSKTESS